MILRSPRLDLILLCSLHSSQPWERSLLDHWSALPGFKRALSAALYARFRTFCLGLYLVTKQTDEPAEHKIILHTYDLFPPTFYAFKIVLRIIISSRIVLRHYSLNFRDQAESLNLLLLSFKCGGGSYVSSRKPVASRHGLSLP